MQPKPREIGRLMARAAVGAMIAEWLKVEDQFEPAQREDFRDWAADYAITYLQRGLPDRKLPRELKPL
jgi:hypothetical protein